MVINSNHLQKPYLPCCNFIALKSPCLYSTIREAAEGIQWLHGCCKQYVYLVLSISKISTLQSHWILRQEGL